jgi:hypothetical protein
MPDDYARRQKPWGLTKEFFSFAGDFVVVSPLAYQLKLIGGNQGAKAPLQCIGVRALANRLNYPLSAVIRCSAASG